MIPVPAKKAHQKDFAKAPWRIENSPMKPFKIGRPIEERAITRKYVA